MTKVPCVLNFTFAGNKLKEILCNKSNNDKIDIQVCNIFGSSEKILKLFQIRELLQLEFHFA